MVLFFVFLAFASRDEKENLEKFENSKFGIYYNQKSYRFFLKTTSSEIRDTHGEFYECFFFE